MDYLYDPNSLYHRAHKYIKKEKIRGKWRYWYNKLTKDNMYYNINSSNYNDKKSQIENTDEWKEIVKSKNPEYVRKKDDGSYEYLYDKYLLNKKHPVIDALTDYNYGRKISTTKQNSSTVAAGVKDYVTMGQRTVENIIGLGVGLISLKVLNQQGSLDDEKRQIRKNINAGKEIVNNLVNTYYQVNTATKATGTATKATGTATKATGTATKAIDTATKAYNNLSDDDKKKIQKVGNTAYNNLSDEDKKKIQKVGNTAYNTYLKNR